MVPVGLVNILAKALLLDQDAVSIVVWMVTGLETVNLGIGRISVIAAVTEAI